MIKGRPVVGLSSGMPGSGIGVNGDSINGGSTFTLAQEQNLNNAPAIQKIRDNESLADTVSPRKLTDMGIGITSDRLGVIPPSNVNAQSIGGHVCKFL
uniref:Uncharacterized protein n=1 Tax=Panagrolaimus sp. PS1159 TaxID=55785 RepID=A0AC35FRK2_9BILA